MRTRHPRGSSGHERRIAKKHWNRAQIHRKNPCPHKPAVPTDLTADFDVKHFARALRIRAKLRWKEVRVDEDGFPIRTKRYDLEWNFSTDGGDTWDDDPDRFKVPSKDDIDSGTKAHRIIHGVRKRFYYRFRVRTVGNTCDSDWSDWFIVGYPTDVFPDTPTDVTIIPKSRDRILLDWEGTDDVDNFELLGEEIAYFQAQISMDPDFTRFDFTVDAGTNTFTASGFSFPNDMLVTLIGPNVPAPLQRIPHRYYVVNRSGDDFQLSLTEGGSAIDVTADGSGVVWTVYKFDRFQHPTRKAFKVHHDDRFETFYGRVRSVNSEGLTSVWIYATFEGNSDPEVAPDGVAPGLGRIVAAWSKFGRVRVKEGAHRWTMDEDGRIKRARATVDIVPDGSDIVIDITKNGTTIFTNPAHRIRIPDGQHTDSAWAEDFDDFTYADGDQYKVNVISAGSTFPGKDLTVQLIGRS
jgi:hypothetical protein